MLDCRQIRGCSPQALLELDRVQNSVLLSCYTIGKAAQCNSGTSRFHSHFSGGQDLRWMVEVCDCCTSTAGDGAFQLTRDWMRSESDFKRDDSFWVRGRKDN